MEKQFLLPLEKYDALNKTFVVATRSLMVFLNLQNGSLSCKEHAINTLHKLRISVL